MSLEWIEDPHLTDGQKNLKWSLWCEVGTYESLEDIEPVLQSLLRDVKEQSGRDEEA